MDASSQMMTEQCETLREQLATKLGVGFDSIVVTWARDTIPGVARVSITLPMSDARELAR